VSDEIRKTGIDIIGDVPWGTHFSVFYETREELSSILVPYFKTGLENNELCLWVLPGTFSVEDAEAALSGVTTDFSQYVKKGQIEILNFDHWYTKSGEFQVREVLECWLKKEQQALERGFDGLRLTGNICWLNGLEEWNSLKLLDYEAEIDSVIARHRMLAICSYSLAGLGATEVLDVIKNHQPVLAREAGEWKAISSTWRRQEELLSQRKVELQVLQHVTAAIHSTLDLEEVFKRITDGATHDLGYATASIILRDRSRGCYQTAAFSARAQLLLEINEVLGYSLSNISVPVSSLFEGERYSEGIWSVMAGRTAVSQTLAEIAYPLISEEACLALQELYQTKSHIAMPLKFNDAMIGILLITSPREEVTGEELMVLRQFADVASQAITNAELHLQTKKTKEELKSSKENLRNVIEKNADSIIIVDRSGTVRFANPAAELFFGRKAKELVGGLFGYPVADGKTTEIDVIRKDGERTVAEMRAVEIEWEGETAYIASLRDITERKKTEEELIKLDRMKSEFISNVSHELRTPLHSIKGFTKLLLLDKVPDPEIQKEFLNRIRERSSHLGQLIDDLLDMSHLESGQFSVRKQPLSMQTLIHELLQGLQTIADGKNITLNEDICPTLPEVEGDENRLKQVILNLLSNAIKFSNNGGSITVRGKIGDDNVLIEVTDQGIGIPQEAVPHLFERFYQVEDGMARGGLGLGLYITGQIVEAHGGRIWVESKPGQGSTFSFTIPRLNVRKNGDQGSNSKKNLVPGSRR